MRVQLRPAEAGYHIVGEAVEVETVQELLACAYERHHGWVCVWETLGPDKKRSAVWVNLRHFTAVLPLPG